MIDRTQYEECYCPQDKDPAFPQNWIRKKYVLDYPPEIQPPYPCDADYEMVINKTILIDNIDNYSIGIYLRLLLLCEYYHNWQEIYKYGNKENVDKALKRLQELKYIEITNNNILKIYS